MTVTDKYWFQVNKRNIILDIVVTIIFILLNMHNIVLLPYYLIRITIYCKRYLCMNKSIENKNDTLNQILTMPFSREQIHRTYIKMMLFLSMIFALFYTIIGLKIRYSSSTPSFMVGDRAVKYTALIRVGDNALSICLLAIVLIFTINRINKYLFDYDDYTIFMIIIFGDIAIQVINSSVAFYSSKYPILQYVFLLVTLAFVICAVYALIRCIHKNYDQFVLRFRRYVHVNEDL